ncbi:hypothetical protein D9757_012143 [Collybiopsis confluens]|uniref:AAA-ATPase-like domain-containing protein n=1 Tax=Collybiopsis confluens TaxID=2823264 RepID=A0A8H5LJY4_9AGAR|nr:hypothetical protein D9757_012143 [Collybiopsis confluens]
MLCLSSLGPVPLRSRLVRFLAGISRPDASTDSDSSDSSQSGNSPFLNFGCVIHRPPGFGKTNFLQQLTTFCDLYSSREYNLPSSQSPHYKSYLVLSFDLSRFDVYPADTEFDGQNLHSRFQDFITRAVRDWAAKYAAEFDLEKLYVDIEQDSLFELVTVLPLLTRHATLILIDSYDSPLISALPEHLSIVEGVVRDVLYRDVLENFACDRNSAIAGILIMGIGTHRKFRTFEGHRLIRDHSTSDDFADAIGLTETDIMDVIKQAGVLQEEQEALFKSVVENCQYGYFTDSEEGGVIYSSREVVTRIISYLSS